MSSSDTNTLYFCIFFLGASFGSLINGCIDDQRWEKDAIKHDAAYYHPQTGKFTWWEQPKEGPQP